MRDLNMFFKKYTSKVEILQNKTLKDFLKLKCGQNHKKVELNEDFIDLISIISL